jgi:archaellum component FlaF (FlaF/FlaG flagellin family)
MPIDFPTSPTTGQVYTYLGKSWVYNGTAWDAPKALSEIGAVQTFANAAARTAAIPTPTEGIVSYLVDTNALELYNNGWNVINPSRGNAIINGAFDIWQRGTSTSTIGGGVFVADRWRATATTASPIGTMSQVAFTPGTLALVETEARFHLRINVTSLNGSTDFGVSQRVEDVRTFAGQTVTVSFYAKSDSTRVNTVSLTQNFGSGGSALVNKTSNFTTTASWQRFSITFSLDSVSGKTIGDGSFLDVKFAPALAVSTFDLWGVQLEAGAVATPFRRNAPSIQAELAACQRYYYRIGQKHLFQTYGNGYGKSGTATDMVIPFPVELRTQPTVSANLTALWLNPDGIPITSLSVDTNVISSQAGAFQTNSASGVTTYRPYTFRAQGSLAPFIEFSAEL